MAVLDLRGLVEELVLVDSGATGSVWRGCYQDQEVAVKKSHAPTFSAQMQQMEEIKLLAALPPHPNVLGLLGAYLEDGCVCCVTPFMPGGSLEARMRDLNAAWLADPDQITALMTGLFCGLSHLHAHGVLHRDCTESKIKVYFQRSSPCLDNIFAQSPPPSAPPLQWLHATLSLTRKGARYCVISACRG